MNRFALSQDRGLVIKYDHLVELGTELPGRRGNRPGGKGSANGGETP